MIPTRRSRFPHTSTASLACALALAALGGPAQAQNAPDAPAAAAGEGDSSLPEGVETLPLEEGVDIDAINPPADARPPAPAPRPAAAPATAPATAPAAAPAAVASPATTPAVVSAIEGVVGTVVDDTGEPLIAALVQVVEGGSTYVETDETGSFELSLPPGQYTLELSFPMFDTRRYELRVEPGQATTLAAVLPLSAEALEVIEITGTINRKSEDAQLQIRKSSVVVSDVLSSQEISRSPDSSASDAVKRVPSVTLDDGKYIVIRGLGGRYVSVLLNGVTLPSPEPDRQAVPLDLFPTGLLSNLTVLKSYSSELPGVFGGGALQIDTNAYPVDFELKLKASTSVDSSATFGGINGQPGGALDFFGYDDGYRGLPGAIPGDMPVDAMADADRESAGEAFANNWELEERSAMPNLSLGGEIGDTLEVGGRRLGYLGAVSFGHKSDAVENVTSKTRLSDGMLGYRETLDGTIGVEEATLSALGNVGYEFGPGHSMNVIGIYTHNGEAVSSFVSGYNETDGENVEQTRLQFVERALTFTQLTGSHRFSQASGLQVDWQGNASFSSRSEPDTRDITYNINNTGTRIYKNQPGSGERFFADLEQRSLGGGLDFKLPLTGVILRAGGAAQHTERDFLGRRFRYRYDTLSGDPAVRELSPSELFRPENIGPTSDGTHSLYLVESTQENDGYAGALDVFATYASADVRVSEDLRFIAGARFEFSDQELSSGNPTAMSGEAESIARTDPALLPSANLVYALGEQMNLRGAYSYTLARPQFRELAPFLYYDPIERVTLEGNPELAMTRIHNAGLRWEWFAAAREVFAISGFYKRFEDPIEKIIYNAAGSRTFDNAQSADAFGAEVEARMSLGRFTPALDRLRVGVNLSLIRSSVELSEMQQGVLTSRERPMQGQAPYVVNFNATYDNPDLVEATLLYNVIGPNITDVASQGLPDVYAEPYHKLDLVLRRGLSDGLKLKVAAQNLLNARIERTQGDLAILSYDPGMSLSLGLEWVP